MWVLGPFLHFGNFRTTTNHFYTNYKATPKEKILTIPHASSQEQAPI